MARRFFITSYDISNDKRRDKVAKALLGYGDRLQYSVFCCQLNPRELLQMQEALKELIHHEEDQIFVVDAGPVQGQTPKPNVEYMGRVWTPGIRAQIV